MNEWRKEGRKPGKIPNQTIKDSLLFVHYFPPCRATPRRGRRLSPRLRVCGWDCSQCHHTHTHTQHANTHANTHTLSQRRKAQTHSRTNADVPNAHRSGICTKKTALNSHTSPSPMYCQPNQLSANLNRTEEEPCQTQTQARLRYTYKHLDKNSHFSCKYTHT